jgi:hypothetical protein
MDRFVAGNSAHPDKLRIDHMAEDLINLRIFNVIFRKRI